MNDIGEKLRYLRRIARKSLREVADASGISHTEISRIERGLRESPSPEILKKLAIGLEVDYEWLLLEFGYIEKIDKPNTELNRGTTYMEKLLDSNNLQNQIYTEFMKLSPENQRIVMDIIQNINKTQSSEDNNKGDS